MNAEEFPTPWQRKALWSALTAVALVTIGSISIGLIWLLFRVLAFLQPILVPFAVAGVMSYLLNPIVSMLVKWGASRLLAVIFVFVVVTVSFAGLTLWLAPAMWTQSVKLVYQVPRYAAYAQRKTVEFSETVHAKYGVTLLPPAAPKQPEGPPAPPTTLIAPDPALPPASTPDPNASPAPPPTLDLFGLFSGDWLQNMLQESGKHLITLTRNSLGGFLGVVGLLLSLIIVPIYLFYFLIEAPTIATTWSDYLPLRASAFKDEVVSVLNEINGYLIAFFRGQLVVSMINGAVTGIGLAIVQLEFGLLIGVVLCFLGIIPYLGITACWVISMVLASMQSSGTWLPLHPFWVFPLVVTGIFFVVHYIDGLFVTPRIVGDSVGLHPFTVIFSVFAWSLLIGGLLGAILAVPMTATVKVLLRRYVWERRFRPAGQVGATREPHKRRILSSSRKPARPITVT